MGNAGLKGARWREVQARVFAEETHCWLCGREVDHTIKTGPRDPLTRWSRSVDHVIPREHLPSDDPLIYDRTNLRLAHVGCNSARRHRLKTQRPEATSSRGWINTNRHVTLICGPPCGGKTTWARQHAAPGDLIVDADQYAQDAGSPTPWNHSAHHHRVAQDEWWRQVKAIGKMPDVTAWIIRCAPRAADRRRIEHLSGASQVVILRASHTELARRAELRPDPHTTQRAIRHWHDRFTPQRHHKTITTDQQPHTVTSSRKW